MALQYPQNVIWYIEARPWNGADEVPGFAPPDPETMGSGIVIELEQLDENNRSYSESKLKKYLLTCGHVVRQDTNDGVRGWGPLLKEIFCWKPGKGYSRTYPNKRKSGEHPGVLKAKVSDRSPCGGISGEVPENLRLPQNDWVLLEIDDPLFEAMPAVKQWGSVMNQISILSIIGFPGGAGLQNQRNNGHFWDTNDLVESTTSKNFQQNRTPETGMLKLNGPDETRPGMSGGGIFDSVDFFVGVHRSVTDAALVRGAVSAEYIQDWIFNNHKLRPIKPYLSGLVPRSVDTSVIRAIVLGNSPKIPFMNRTKLRGNLDSLTRLNNGYKVVSLNGQKGTGKSHTWHLLQYVAFHHSVTPVLFDISQSYDVEDACESIVDQMGLDVADMREKVLVDKPAKERIGRKFSSWLARATAANKPKKWWLVIDGLDDSDNPSPDLNENLVQWLIRGLRQDLNFTQVVLIMLGAIVPPDPILGPYILEERLEAMTRMDVETFVSSYAESIGRTLSPVEMSDLTYAIAGNLSGPFDPQQMSVIQKQITDIIERVLI